MNDLLAITLGNSSVVMATMTDDGALHDLRREPLARLEDLFAEFVPAPQVRQAPIIVASVNPAALARLRAVAPAAGPAAPKAARDDFPIPIATDVDESRRAGIGVDRLLAALAAYRLTGSACVVVDCGTAVTVDAVDAGGTFLGGAIFPGRDMMARALAEGAAQLPKVAIGPAESVVGRNTEDAIRAGIVHGSDGALAALIAGAQAVAGQGATVILTGGDAPLPGSPVLRPGYKVRPDLVLAGLVMAYSEWQER